MSLYNKLVLVLTQHPINELGILPCTPEIVDIPPLARMYHPLLMVECKLGISFDVLGQLLKETQEKITELRQQSLDDASWELATRVMVLLKPEHYTAMNARKQLVISGQVNIQDELILNQLIFTIPRNTKSSIAWHHREWLFTHSKQGADHMNLENEMALCQRSITLYPRNYYAWNYRHWLLTWMMTTTTPLQQQQQRQQQQQQQIINDNDTMTKVYSEYQTTRQWLETNISDHTGIRYMEKTLEMLLSSTLQQQQQQQQQQLYAILQQHMVWLDDLLLRYPGHESLWCHRRYCATLFFQNGSHRQHHHFSAIVLHQWLQQQHAWIQQLMDSSGNNSDSRQPQLLEDENKMKLQQLGLAAKYGIWLCYLEAKQAQTDESMVKTSLMEFYMDQVQQLGDAPIYLHYLKELWIPLTPLHDGTTNQDFTPS